VAQNVLGRRPGLDPRSNLLDFSLHPMQRVTTPSKKLSISEAVRLCKRFAHQVSESFERNELSSATIVGNPCVSAERIAEIDDDTT
jgi:hypothetical protein